MDAKHWDAVAANYDKLIFDSLASDLHGHMTEMLDRLASKRKTAADFGCGVGKYLPALAQRFGHVVAMDHSAECLAIARRRCRHLSRIEFHAFHLGRVQPPIARVDVGLCVNVLLSPSDRERRTILQNIHTALKPGGRLIVLAPSLESALFTRHRQDDSRRRARKSGSSGMTGAVRFTDHSPRQIADGHLRLNRVLTKHHLRQELELALNSASFAVEDVRRLEYDWKNEFDSPPRWMKAPYPWDWLILARAIGKSSR